MQKYFERDEHRKERAQLPLLTQLIDRYRDEKPFAGMRVASNHLLVRNSLVTLEAVYAGGADLILADAFPSPATEPVKADLMESGVSVLSVLDAVQEADIYLDVNAVLGRQKIPRMAAEVTRTGVLHYEGIDCVVISADDCASKKIEGFYGTGNSLLRIWPQFFPNESLAGKRVIQFGFGKIGKGVAYQLTGTGADLLVVEALPAKLDQAANEGFEVLDFRKRSELEKQLGRADVVVSVTGLPGMLSKQIPKEWVTANHPVLVSLGAEDEFGDQYTENEILGGKEVPLNFHLEEPTLNRYVDAPLAAHVLALEAWSREPEKFDRGIHPLPVKMDRWVIEQWRAAWPDEDLSGIGEELGLQ